MEPFTEKEREEIRRLQSEGYSYLEAVVKMHGVQSFEVILNGESIPLKSIGEFMGSLILAKSNLLNILEMAGSLQIPIVYHITPKRKSEKIKRPPQPNRRKKKRARRK